MKKFCIIALAVFSFYANASTTQWGTHHGPRVCGACHKPTRGFWSANHCEVAKGYRCHPGLKSDGKGGWTADLPPKMHHKGPFPCEKCGEPCPRAYIIKQCSKSGECRPKMPQWGPHHGFPPCGACGKQTKGPGKNDPCSVANGHKCHPGLKSDGKGGWIVEHRGTHHGMHRMGPPPCEKCEEPCPPPHMHKQCSKGGECRPKMPAHAGPKPMTGAERAMRKFGFK